MCVCARVRMCGALGGHTRTDGGKKPEWSVQPPADVPMRMNRESSVRISRLLDHPSERRCIPLQQLAVPPRSSAALQQEGAAPAEKKQQRPGNKSALHLWGLIPRACLGSR